MPHRAYRSTYGPPSLTYPPVLATLSHMDTIREIILASGSPRRKDLLEQAGYTFRVTVSDVEETDTGNDDPAQTARRNAAMKAWAVAKSSPHSAIVIGADTIVVLDGRIFGKPANAIEAKGTLQTLSGRTHQVITGVCVITEGQEHTFAETTNVRFRSLTPEEIDAYVATGEPLDKAGAYGIQGAGRALVDRIEGDYDNVVGLPITRLKRALDFKSGDKIDDGKHT